METRALKDANDNSLEEEVCSLSDSFRKSGLKGETKGAEAAVDLKAEAAKRRQSRLTYYNYLLSFFLYAHNQFTKKSVASNN